MIRFDRYFIIGIIYIWCCQTIVLRNVNKVCCNAVIIEYGLRVRKQWWALSVTAPLTALATWAIVTGTICGCLYPIWGLENSCAWVTELVVYATRVNSVRERIMSHARITTAFGTRPSHDYHTNSISLKQRSKSANPPQLRPFSGIRGTRPRCVPPFSIQSQQKNTVVIDGPIQEPAVTASARGRAPNPKSAWAQNSARHFV